MQAINDAESMRKFRKQLDELANNLNSRLKETEHEVQNLSKTWKDFEFKRFNERFEEDKKQIIPLSKKIKEFESDYLRRKEEKIRKYLGN